MDRRYKAIDRVAVFQSIKVPQAEQPMLDAFEDRPYTRAGMDCFLYKEVMYGAFVAVGETPADSVIFLDAPMFKAQA